MKVEKPRFEKNAWSVFYRRRRRAAMKTGSFQSSLTLRHLFATLVRKQKNDLNYC